MGEQSVKLCKRCGEEKLLSEFHKRSDAKCGVVAHCKECKKKKSRERYLNFSDKEREILAERSREWKSCNKEYIARYNKKYATENKTSINEGRRNFRTNNRERILAREKDWRERNIEMVAKRRSEYRASKKKNDPQYAMSTRLRSRLHGALRGLNKSKSTMELIGCSINQLTAHIESLFVDGMNWENRDKWHIDHIRPCASFDLTQPDQQMECFNYKNLQPLWANDNISKRDKYEFKTGDIK